MYEWGEFEKFLGNRIGITRYFWTDQLRTRAKFRYISNVYVFCNQQRFSLLSYLEGSLRCNSSSIMKMQFSFINGEVCLAHIWVKRSQWVKPFLKEYISDFSQYFGSIFMNFFRKKKKVTNFHKFSVQLEQILFVIVWLVKKIMIFFFVKTREVSNFFWTLLHLNNLSQFSRRPGEDLPSRNAWEGNLILR